MYAEAPSSFHIPAAALPHRAADSMPLQSQARVRLYHTYEIHRGLSVLQERMQTAMNFVQKP